MKKPTILGMDLAKSIFQLHGVDENGKVTCQKRLPRSRLKAFIANLRPCVIGMEACGSSHYWAREFKKLGHEVRLVSPQFVKPYVKSNKNDYHDAAAICEAVSRPHMRFVSVKSVEQQDIQALHRIRERLVGERTALVNQIRGLLAEYGIIIPQGVRKVHQVLPRVLEDGENELTTLGREIFSEMHARLRASEMRITEYEQRIGRILRNHPLCQRLVEVEGVGPLISTALVAAVGDARVFKNGRQMGAWLGLVPRQHSSGGKTVLRGISKRGDRYLRTLLIHGARNVVRYADVKHDARSRWLTALKNRRGLNIAAVALANKNARILWALLAGDEAYRKAA